jgi:hypothetical protein
MPVMVRRGRTSDAGSTDVVAVMVDSIGKEAVVANANAAPPPSLTRLGFLIQEA